MSTQAKQRVAVYCRVSTELEHQQTSLHTQMSTFQDRIRTRPDWELAEVYADEGTSGGSTARRTEFQRMIADCEAGKIDRILTKSISRFARNTVDTLQYVRRLKEMGVYVYFERDHIDTSTLTSELVLTVLAAVAQEESYNLSENVKWSYRKKFEAGETHWRETYGYRKGEKGETVIYEPEAEIVRYVFERYERGCSLPEICREMEQKGMKNATGTRWRTSSLSRWLCNERYVGDVSLQKTYRPSFMENRHSPNDGTVVPRYYVCGHHEGIVSREQFERVQKIRAMKDMHRGCVQYPYYGTLVCPICGGNMVSVTVNAPRTERAWVCAGKAEMSEAREKQHGAVLRQTMVCLDELKTVQRGERSGCPLFVIRHRYVDAAVRDAVRALDDAVLRRAARRKGVPGRAARAVLDWKKNDPELRRIEFLLLDLAVSSITFPSWEEAEIKWKFGVVSRVGVKYLSPKDYPVQETFPAGVTEWVNAAIQETPDARMRPGVFGKRGGSVRKSRMMVPSRAVQSDGMKKGGKRRASSENSSKP